MDEMLERLTQEANTFSNTIECARVTMAGDLEEMEPESGLRLLLFGR